MSHRAIVRAAVLSVPAAFALPSTATPDGAQTGFAEYLQNLHETPARGFGTSA